MTNVHDTWLYLAISKRSSLSNTKVLLLSLLLLLLELKLIIMLPCDAEPVT